MYSCQTITFDHFVCFSNEDRRQQEREKSGREFKRFAARDFRNFIFWLRMTTNLGEAFEKGLFLCTALSSHESKLRESEERFREGKTVKCRFSSRENFQFTFPALKKWRRMGWRGWQIIWYSVSTTWRNEIQLHSANTSWRRFFRSHSSSISSSVHQLRYTFFLSFSQWMATDEKNKNGNLLLSALYCRLLFLSSSVCCCCCFGISKKHSYLFAFSSSVSNKNDCQLCCAENFSAFSLDRLRSGWNVFRLLQRHLSGLKLIPITTRKVV